MASTELELKLEIGADALRKLPDNPALHDMAAGESAKRALRSIYFDTADLRLHHAQSSLRVRWDGETWTQTLKRGTKLNHGLASPIEIESEVDGPDIDMAAITDPAVREWLSELISDQALTAVFETDMHRNISLLTVDGDGTVELAIDQGAVQNADKKHDFSEVELELKSGNGHALLTASEKLFGTERIAASGSSKAERGYALLRQEDGESAADTGLRMFTRPALTPCMPADQAIKAIGKAAADQILGNWDALAVSDDPEVPHQLRIGLRRMRTALKIFRSATDIDDLRPLSVRARDMGRIVGELRNADVIVDDIVVPAIDDLGMKKRHAALLEFLQQERLRQRVAVRQALAGADWTFFKLNCMLFDHAVDRALRDQAMPGDVMALAAGALDRAWRSVRKKGRGFARHKISERHELRKELKELRYTCDPFLPLYADTTAKKFLRDLRRLQDVFGYLNDVAMAEQLAATIAAEQPERKDLRKSVSNICKWHGERARVAMKKADARWRKLVDDPKFWR